MNFEEYMKSEQARTDVRALLAKNPDPGGSQARWHATKEPLLLSWLEGPNQAWRDVAVFGPDTSFLSARCYYRPDGDRFIVSDLGEGVKAHALRFGTCDTLAKKYDSTPIASAVGCWEQGVMLVDGAIWPKENLPFRQGIKPEQLPDAICRVLLASYRVANLPDQPVQR